MRENGGFGGVAGGRGGTWMDSGGRRASDGSGGGAERTGEAS